MQLLLIHNLNCPASKCGNQNLKHVKGHCVKKADSPVGKECRNNVLGVPGTLEGLSHVVSATEWENGKMFPANYIK